MENRVKEMKKCKIEKIIYGVCDEWHMEEKNQTGPKSNGVPEKLDLFRDKITFPLVEG